MTHKQDVCMKSRSSPQKVYKGSEHVQRQHAPSDHTACTGWARCHKHATKNSRQLQSPTVSHSCARSLLKPCSTSSNRSNVCCIKVARIACNASTRAHLPDSASASRLLVSASSPLSYPITETVSPFQTLDCLQRFRESVYCVRLRRFLDHR